MTLTLNPGTRVSTVKANRLVSGTVEQIHAERGTELARVLACGFVLVRFDDGRSVVMAPELLTPEIK